MKIIDLETNVESASLTIPELESLKGKRVHVRIEELPPTGKPTYIPPGLLKGRIWMSPDFDEPLEDFKEYME